MKEERTIEWASELKSEWVRAKQAQSVQEMCFSLLCHVMPYPCLQHEPPSAFSLFLSLRVTSNVTSICRWTFYTWHGMAWHGMLCYATHCRRVAANGEDVDCCRYCYQFRASVSVSGWDSISITVSVSISHSFYFVFIHSVSPITITSPTYLPTLSLERWLSTRSSLGGRIWYILRNKQTCIHTHHDGRPTLLLIPCMVHGIVSSC